MNNSLRSLSAGGCDTEHLGEHVTRLAEACAFAIYLVRTFGDPRVLSDLSIVQAMGVALTGAMTSLIEEFGTQWSIHDVVDATSSPEAFRSRVPSAARPTSFIARYLSDPATGAEFMDQVNHIVQSAVTQRV